eukprot:TRINITY_DN4551_c0_g2_i1.p1 TRINITY_DN4551_c0_g2~~TRINITY_DN4551_c0_g2_i1.p1  ORF type:complete len:103 (-),score=6.82 TRINITY_DN4551_c0_g2_i1:14-322(-)
MSMIIFSRLQPLGHNSVISRLYSTTILKYNLAFIPLDNPILAVVSERALDVILAQLRASQNSAAQIKGSTLMTSGIYIEIPKKLKMILNSKFTFESMHTLHV